jgi:large subunit ribosomal protein L24
MIKSKIRINDNVAITKGKDLGKTGKVLQVLVEKRKVVVENINQYKKHQKPVGKNKGGILTITKPLSIANVALVCPSCKKKTRVGFEIKAGVKSRICKKCQAVIKTEEKKKK